MLPRAVQRLAAALGSAVVLVGLTWITASGQGTTGKIQGRVVNAETGTPIAAAQVSIEGTTLGNITNDDGFYFINEVPPGVVSVRAQSIGYQAVVISEQGIQAGQTTTLNFRLNQSAVQLDALIVTGERNPLVPRDQVSSKSIVSGAEIDALPMDNSSSIILLQPGVIDTNSGRTIRGSRPGEEAVYVDGVPVRRLRTGNVQPIDLPTNVLAQVDVVTGGIGAQYGDAQSGVVNYVTRTGGSTFGGTAAYMFDGAVKDWSNAWNRAELSLGGPIPWVNNMTFFVGGTADGRLYGGTNQGLVNSPGWYYQDGVDTVFTLPRTSSVSGMVDSVQFAVPNFSRWTDGNRNPTSQADNYDITAKLSYGLPRGGKIDLTGYRNRSQSMSIGLTNPDSRNVGFSTENMLTLSTYFLLHQTSDSQLALDIKGSYQSDWSRDGDVNHKWFEDHFRPVLGFNFSTPDFLTNVDQWPLSDKLVDVYKAGILPADSGQIYPRVRDLAGGSWAPGVTDDILRVDPYGRNGGWSYGGADSPSWSKETRKYGSASIDWQVNRFNRINMGGDITKTDSWTRSVGLYSGTGSATHFKPVRAGVFVQNRLDIGDVVLEGGLRYDYFQPDAEWPRIPGFVFNVPDSLKQDFVYITAQDPSNPTGYLDRVSYPGDCGGQATAADRTNADGQVVCKPNFIQSERKTSWSPRLAVSFPVTATSTFRFSYSHNTQVPSVNRMITSVYSDLQGGTNTNATFGRDVEVPRTVLFEAGYRQVFGGQTVVDVSAYSKKTANSLTYRKLPFGDPVTGGTQYLNVLTNADFSLARGVDVHLDRRFSQIADLALNYSFVNAEGTGSDVGSYVNLIARRSTNLFSLTGVPVEAPEVLLPLNQSRAHNLSGTLSLLFPADFHEGSAEGAILSDLGVFTTLRWGSGLPYTRLVNIGDGSTGPPTSTFFGVPAEQVNASRSPSTLNIDMRFVRGVRVAGKRMRLTADFRNPFHIVNTNSVYLETGTIDNAVYRENYVYNYRGGLTATGVPADNIDINAINDAVSASANALNRYMLHKVDERFGDGDGILTLAEQEKIGNILFDLNHSPLSRRNGNRSLRLGLEFVF